MNPSLDAATTNTTKILETTLIKQSIIVAFQNNICITLVKICIKGKGLLH